jgi:hypothetical protein
MPLLTWWVALLEAWLNSALPDKQTSSGTNDARNLSDIGRSAVPAPVSAILTFPALINR